MLLQSPCEYSLQFNLNTLTGPTEYYPKLPLETNDELTFELSTYQWNNIVGGNHNQLTQVLVSTSSDTGQPNLEILDLN